MPTDNSADRIDRGSRDYRPEINLYVAEYGPEHREQYDTTGRLAFHSFEEAKEWVADQLYCDPDKFRDVGADTWRFESDVGPWGEIKKTRVTQPRRLLRDDR